MKIAEYVDRVEPSPTMAITAKAKAMIRDGVDVIPMSAGEPDFDTPQHIKDAAITAIEDGFTKYTSPPSGIVELKEAICEAFRRDNGLAYGVDEVIVNVGAKHSIFLALAALLDPGDEVIVPTPYWVTFTEQPKLVGASAKVVETRPENGLKMTAEEFRRAITPRTRMLILNSPSNPSGAVYSRSELEGLAEVAVDRGIFVVADEIYQKLIYDDVEHVSIASLSDEMKSLSIVVNGLSKTYAMTGWRVGFAGAAREVISAMDKVQRSDCLAYNLDVAKGGDCRTHGTAGVGRGDATRVRRPSPVRRQQAQQHKPRRLFHAAGGVLRLPGHLGLFRIAPS